MLAGTSWLKRCLASRTSLATEEVAPLGHGVMALANPTLSDEQIERLGHEEYQYKSLEGAAQAFVRCYLGEEGPVHVGSEAEEPVAYRDEDGSRIVVYASHGMLNPRFPLNSKLLLAPGSTEPVDGDTRRPEDGDYHGWEAILTDHRGVELVVLAACETLLPAFRNLQGTLAVLSGKPADEVELSEE